MIHSGLVSITFRKLAPQEIVDLVAQSGLDAIEWGGDIHAPHGDVARAREVQQMTLDAGLTVAAYGSYYRVGHGEPGPFAQVVESAVALGAPLIRVWAGKQETASADAAYWERVIQDSRAIADLAQQAGLVIAYEFHGNTLTDTHASTRKLLKAVARDNIKTYWQPLVQATVADNLAGLDAVRPWLTNVHVFSWRAVDGQHERLLLEAQTVAWAQYFAKIATTGRDHIAMIEFVRDDTPENFLKDAATLKAWLGAD